MWRPLRAILVAGSLAFQACCQSVDTQLALLDRLRHTEHDVAVDLQPKLYVLNPSLWWEDVSTQVNVLRANITGSGQGTVVDITDISATIMGPGTNSIILQEGLLTVSNLSFFSDIVLRQSSDLKNYLAWIQPTGSAQVVYRNTTLLTVIDSDLSALQDSIRTSGGAVKLLASDTLMAQAVDLGGLRLVDSLIMLMKSATAATFGELSQALQDNSINYIRITGEIDEDKPETQMPAVVLQRPVILASTGQTWRQNTTPFYAVSVNASLNLKGLVFIQPPGTVPLYEALAMTCPNYNKCGNLLRRPPNPATDGVTRLQDVTSISSPNLTAVAMYNRLSCKEGDVVYSLPSPGTLVIEKWQINGGVHPTCNASNTYLRVTNTTQQGAAKSTSKRTLTIVLSVLLPTICLALTALCAGTMCFGLKRKALKRDQKKQTALQKLTAVATRVLGKETVVFELLGTGSFANVYRAQCGSEIVALKVTFPITSTDHNVEAHLGSSLQHPNIVNTIRSAHRMVDPKKADQAVDIRKWPSVSLSTSNSNSPEAKQPMDLEKQGYLRENWILLEYCDRKSIKYCVMHNTFNRTWPNILLTLRDVANALQYMHDHNVTHGDLNTNNIMLKSDSTDKRGYVAKVADFGLAQNMYSWQQKKKVTMSFGTVTHQPPELLQNGELSRQTDIYAFGIVMYELYTGEQPYKGQKHGDIIRRVSRENLRPSFPSGTPEEYRMLAQQCWHERPAKRADLVQIQSGLAALIKEYITRATKSKSENLKVQVGRTHLFS